MLIARAQVESDVFYGQIVGERVQRIAGDIFGQHQLTDESYQLSEVKLLAPVEPGKLICVGFNYLSHRGELASEFQIPEEPVFFLVSPTAIVGPEEAIELPPTDHVYHYEAELTVVIGKTARDVAPEQVADYVFGYTCGNDVSDRTLQKKDGQWTRAKSFHTFKPVGPFIATDLNPCDLNISARINGEVRQNSNTRHLIRDVSYLVSYISQVMTLYPGDIIMTGTPEGVGPLSPGDTCEIEVQGVGVLKNPVVRREA